MSSASQHLNILDEVQNKEIRKKSRIAAILAILFWFLILAYPLFTYTFPLPEKAGILMSFGEDEGGGEQASVISSAESEETKDKPEASSAPQKVEDTELSKKVASAKTDPSKITQQTDEVSVIKTTQKVVTEIEKSKVTEKGIDREKVEAEKKASEEAAQKAKRQEEAEQRKAQEDAKTKEFGEFFSGQGSDNSDKVKGDPLGDPDKKKLDGISTGKGNIGGGLAERGVLYEPQIDENSQKIGRIVVRVCVNSKGDVIEAKYTQKGSTSTDLTLIDVAEKAAKMYKFTGSGLEKQCGSISIDFKLQ